MRMRAHSSALLAVPTPVPLAVTLVGSPLDDTLAALGPGDVLDGQAGNDTLTSLFDDTTLYGGLGDDVLLTDVAQTVAGGSVDLGAEAHGGDGDDDVTVALFTTGLASVAMTTRVSGGIGADRIAVTTTVDSNWGNPGGSSSLRNVVDGGDGADTIDVAAILTNSGEGWALAHNSVYGGTGDDVISALAEANSYYDHLDLANFIDAGDGNDSVIVIADGDFDGMASYASNTVYGGAGNDDVYAYARVESNASWLAANELYGGDGDDILTAETYLNSNGGGPTARGRLFGGTGADILTLIHDEFTDGGNTLDFGLYGGSHNDLLVADVTVAATYGIDLILVMDGEDGNDILDAAVAGVSSVTPTQVILSGGAGLDTLSASQVLFAYTSGFFGSSAVSNSLSGGADADVLVSTIDYVNEFAAADGFNSLAGGDGDDTITALTKVQNLGSVSSVAENRVDGGAGNDTIDVEAQNFGFLDEIARNIVTGGSGNDTITARGNDEGGAANTTVANSLWGGSGADSLSGYADVNANSADLALNELHGGRGADILTGETRVGSNSSSPTGRNLLYGGAGADSLTAIHRDTGENDGGREEAHLAGDGGRDTLLLDVRVTSLDRVVDGTLLGGTGRDALALDASLAGGSSGLGALRATLDGGDGNDTIDARVTSLADDLAVALTLLGGLGADTIRGVYDSSAAAPFGPSDSAAFDADGGDGNDRIETVALAFAMTSASADTTLRGGAGNDVLAATGAAIVSDPVLGTALAENRLDGGLGDDRLSATIVSNGQGASTLLGGDGDDVLAVQGGDGNVLAGGAGDDRLTLSAGADILSFRTDLDEGVDVVRGWDPAHDRLNLFDALGALVDLGLPGLADDIDALATVTDDGRDVLVTLASGTTIRFAGAGTGSVSGIADLVYDPLTQLMSDPTLVALF